MSPGAVPMAQPRSTPRSSVALTAFAPRVDPHAARRRLAPAAPWRWVAPRAGGGHLELVHLRYRLATATVRYLEGRETCEREIACLVCANTGAAFRIDPSRLALAPTPVNVLPARLDDVELDRLALDHLRRWSAAPRRPRGTRLHGEPRCEDRAYPIWMAIEPRPGDRFEVSGLDGVTGARIGSATRQALLLALARTVASTPAGEAPSTSGDHQR